MRRASFLEKHQENLNKTGSGGTRERVGGNKGGTCAPQGKELSGVVEEAKEEGKGEKLVRDFAKAQNGDKSDLEQKVKEGGGGMSSRIDTFSRAAGRQHNGKGGPGK